MVYTTKKQATAIANAISRKNRKVLNRELKEVYASFTRQGIISCSNNAFITAVINGEIDWRTGKQQIREAKPKQKSTAGNRNTKSNAKSATKSNAKSNTIEELTKSFLAGDITAEVFSKAVELLAK